MLVTYFYPHFQHITKKHADYALDIATSLTAARCTLCHYWGTADGLRLHKSEHEQRNGQRDPPTPCDICDWAFGCAVSKNM